MVGQEWAVPDRLSPVQHVEHLLRAVSVDVEGPDAPLGHHEEGIDGIPLVGDDGATGMVALA